MLTKSETVFLTALNLVYIKLNINGDDVDALVDRGASVSVINQALVKGDEIIKGDRCRYRVLMGQDKYLING